MDANKMEIMEEAKMVMRVGADDLDRLIDIYERWNVPEKDIEEIRGTFEEMIDKIKDAMIAFINAVSDANKQKDENEIDEVAYHIFMESAENVLSKKIDDFKSAYVSLLQGWPM